MPQQPPTRSGQLSDIARHVVLPSGITSTGWPAVRDTCRGFGVRFDPWQDGAGRAILAKRKDGTYAASIGGIVISIPRQVGKTYLVGAIVFALCQIFPGLTVIWTAHRLRTAGETFASMQAFARRAKVKALVAKIVLGSGDEAIVFHNGSRILFGARERGFGRGFANVGVLVFDEAQILGENAIDDMVPATNTATNPLLLFTGTPPKPTDPSEVFTRKRKEALAGEAEDTVYIEFSADRGAGVKDRDQWAKANPSYPMRTNDAAMLRMLKNLSDESFIREGLGVWDAEGGTQVISRTAWADCLNTTSEVTGTPTFALEIDRDRTYSCIAAAGRSSLGEFVHGQSIRYEAGSAWCVDAAKELHDQWNLPIVVQTGTPAAALIPQLEAAGVPVREVSTEEHARACGQFFDMTAEARFRHIGQGELDTSVRNAVKKDQGSGAFVWDRKKPAVDVSPLVAVTLAAYVHGLPEETSNPQAVWL